MVFFTVIVIVFLFFSIKHPDFMFWLAVTILLDPGGYIQTYINRAMIGGIQIWDLKFVLLFIPLLSHKIYIRYYFKFKDNRWIFNFLLIFALVYHIFVYGFLIPGESFSALLSFLQYERLCVVGFIAIVPAYIFFRRSYSLLVKFAFISSVILAAFYLITLTTKLPLIPLVFSERGLGTNAMRIGMLSYGYVGWFIYIAIVVLLFRFKVAYKNWIYFMAITFFIAVILTLTRRSILSIFYATFLVYFIHQKIQNHSVFSTKVIKFVFALGVAFIALWTIAPKYVGLSVDMVNSAVNYVIPIEKNQQIEDVRLDHDIPEHINRFKSSPIFGYGYDYLWYSNKVEEGGLSANDVPLTAALGMFGIVGLLWFSIYYFKIFSILFRTFKILKLTYLKRNIYQKPVVFIIVTILLISFISKYTLSFMEYFGEIIRGEYRVVVMLNLGFLLAARDILINRITVAVN